MAITKVSNSGIKSGMTKYDSFLAGNAAYDPGSYWLIERVTVGSGGASSITFSSIPSGYTHLQIRASLKEPGGYVNNFIRFNSDTGTNYSNHYLDGTGSIVEAGAGTSTSAMALPVLGNQWGVAIVDILDYTNTNKYKTLRYLGGVDNNGSGYVDFGSGAWRNTNAVTTVTLVSRFSGWAQYSTAALYGIKG